MKNILSVLVILVIGAGIFFGKKHFLNPKPLELPKYGNYLSCIGYPFDLKAKFTSQFYLAKAALPKDEKTFQRLQFSAAYYQNMYTFTNLTDYNVNHKMKWSSLGDKDPDLKVIKIEDAPYPHDVYMPATTEILGFPPGPQKYIENIRTLGKIRKGDPAVKVTYEFSNDLLTCFMENKTDFTNIKFFQPLDPYTTYFILPEDKRRPIYNPGRKAEQNINPCINPLGVAGTTFSPFYMWFFWRPTAEGHDSNKQAFNCNEYYKAGETIQELTIDFSENQPKETNYLAFDKFEKLDRPLSVAIFLGSSETRTFKKLNKADGEEYIKLYLSGIDSSRARNDLPIEKYDAKFSTFLWLSRNISDQMEIKVSDAEVDEFFARVTIKGKLKLSKKDVVIKIFLHQNNPKFEGADYFDKHFAPEFLSNDIIVYGGHVNGGNVFGRGIENYASVIKENENKKIDYQIFAIFSCTASFFFRPETFPKISNQNFERDFIRTGGGFSDGSSNSSLILIGQVDSYLYNKKYAPFAFWSKMAKSDNFYILSNH